MLKKRYSSLPCGLGIPQRRQPFDGRSNDEPLHMKSIVKVASLLGHQIDGKDLNSQVSMYEKSGAASDVIITDTFTGTTGKTQLIPQGLLIQSSSKRDCHTAGQYLMTKSKMGKREPSVTVAVVEVRLDGSSKEVLQQDTVISIKKLPSSGKHLRRGRSDKRIVAQNGNRG